MRTSAELQLRKIALFLTAAVLAQLVWSGVRLWMISEPEPLPPASESLQVDEIRQSAALSEEQSQSLAARPLFWEGRQAFIPSVDAPQVSEQQKKQTNSNIDDIALQGVYNSGGKAGVIVDYKGKHHRLLQDESIAGWTFTMLGGDGPVFESGEELRVLELQHARSVPAPMKTQAPSPPVQDRAYKNNQDRNKYQKSRQDKPKQDNTGE